MMFSYTYMAISSDSLPASFLVFSLLLLVSLLPLYIFDKYRQKYIILSETEEGKKEGGTRGWIKMMEERLREIDDNDRSS